MRKQKQRKLDRLAELAQADGAVAVLAEAVLEETPGATEAAIATPSALLEG